MPLVISRSTYVFTSLWYAVPPYAAGTSAVPSQHSSFSGTRTARIFQLRMALIEDWSIGPSQKPLPWMQANSPPERLTPCSVTVCPDRLTSLLPETLRAGAAPVGGPVVGPVVGVVV